MKKSKQILAALFSAALLTGTPAIALASEYSTFGIANCVDEMGIAESIRLSTTRVGAMSKTCNPRSTGQLSDNVVATSKMADGRIVGYTRNVGITESAVERTRMETMKSRVETTDTGNLKPFDLLPLEHF